MGTAACCMHQAFDVYSVQRVSHAERWFTVQLVNHVSDIHQQRDGPMRFMVAHLCSSLYTPSANTRHCAPTQPCN